jgi:cellulose synthase (UDP-forming)
MRLRLENVDRLLRERAPGTKRALTRVAVALGSVAAAYYFSWWFAPPNVLGPWQVTALGAMLLYATLQLFFAWYAYLRIEIPAPRPAPPGLAVDLFVPVYRESVELVDAAIAAAVAVRYPHRTWLLDDAGRDEFREIAARHGAEYVRRATREGEKAGNVNHALGLATGDYVAILDVDHFAEPQFLDEVLGHFDRPEIGFVQALVAHRNQDESLVAKAGSGQADDVFGPSSMGWHGCGAALAWGAHCTFRRAALDAIGGYRIGLAEDLLTSLALHGAGWRSVYVPRVVARGLVPADLGGYFLQHLKWSNGVLGTLLGGGLPAILRLRPSQAVCYLTRMSYYLLGPVVFGHLLLLLWGLLTGAELRSYFAHALPLAVMAVVIRKVVGAMWEQDPRAGWQLLGTALAVSSWPVYLLSLVCAVFRVRIPHLATPKETRGGNFALLVLPQLAACVALAIAAAVALRRGGLDEQVARLVAAGGAIAVHVVAFRGVVDGWRRRRRATI